MRFKYSILFILFALFYPSIQLDAQDLIEQIQTDKFAPSSITELSEVAKMIAIEKQAATFHPIQTLQLSRSMFEDTYESVVSDAVLLSLSPQLLANLNQNRPKNILFGIPVAKDKQLQLELTSVNIKAKGYQVVDSNGSPQEVHENLFYRGIVKGLPEASAALSIFKEEVRLIIFSADGNYVLGKLDNKQSFDYIFYNDRKLKATHHFNCATEYQDIPASPKLDKNIEDLEKNSSTHCVQMYIEADYELYQDKGGVAGTQNYVEGLFHESATLYTNESINIVISQLKVWDRPDPYDESSSRSALQDLRRNLGTQFEGDLAHLVTTSRNNNGGVAFINVLCNKTLAFAYSNIRTTYQEVPTYSWSVEVFTHEAGHNLGSPHTHDCAWNGNQTQLDDCGNLVVSGSECFDGRNPIIPREGGTIMSYCHLNGVGINFSFGFGEQPGELMRNQVASAAGRRCISSESCSRETCVIAPPTIAQLSTTQITTISARLNSSKADVNRTNWRYRAAARTQWNESIPTEEQYKTIMNLSPNTRYEWQAQSICESGEGDWSVSKFFVTQNNAISTANDYVKPYDKPFGYGANLGYYPNSSGASNWTDAQLGDIAMGNPSIGVSGIGVNTLRPALPEWFQRQWGYEFRLPTFQHFDALNAKDNVVLLGFPSEINRDPITYCAGEQSELFKNMYEAIWDGGANGTAVNEDNHYAAYVYETVTRYKDYVRFWEVLNEPDFTEKVNELELRTPNATWWTENPDPCDYAIKAPIQHYVRLLRISYEIIKSIDEDAYVAIGGIGYPSFLDAVLRNTDNPNQGQVEAAYPLRGGAYFDVLSYHSYPHFDGSLSVKSSSGNHLYWQRNTDRAVDGMIDLHEQFTEVLQEYGYDGMQYPNKEWIITESNAPRIPLRNQWGSDEIQVNFMMKALVEAQKYNIRQLHFYTLGDKADEGRLEASQDEYDLMGMYKNLRNIRPYNQSLNEVGMAYKTTSLLLQGKRFDHRELQRLDLPAAVRGGAFVDDAGVHTYVLWARISNDLSEERVETLDLSRALGTTAVEVREWDFSATERVSNMPSNSITLTGRPIIITIAETPEICEAAPIEITLSNPRRASCNQDNGQVDISISNGTPNYEISWSGSGEGNRITSRRQLTITNLAAGDYVFRVIDANDCTAEASVTIDRSNGCNECEDFAVEWEYPGDCGTDARTFGANVVGTPPYMIAWLGASVGNQTFSVSRAVFTAEPGTYSVTIMDASGCEAETTITATEKDYCADCNQFSIELQNTSSSCGIEDGKVDVLINGGSGNINIRWAGPKLGTLVTEYRSATIYHLADGDYTITAIDENGCSVETTLNIAAPNNCANCDNFNVNLDYLVEPNCNPRIKDGVVEMDIASGTPSFNLDFFDTRGFLISSNRTGSRQFRASNVISGYVNVTSQDGCGASVGIRRSTDDCTDSCELNSTVSVVQQADCNIANGIIEIETDGQFSLKVEIDGAIQTEVWAHSNTFPIQIYDMPTGTYSITITDSYGCQSTSTLQVSCICDELSLIIEEQADANCGEADGSFSALASNGTPPYNYDIGVASNRNGNFYYLDAGIYQLTVTDANACTATQSIRIEEDCLEEECQQFPTIRCDATIEGTTADGNNDYNGNCNTALPGKDQLYKLLLNQSAQVDIDLSNITDDIDLFLLSSCEADAICLESSINGGVSNENIQATLSAGAYYILIDSYKSFIESPYTLSVSCSGDGCQCTDSTVDAFCENFDSYELTALGPQSDCWTTWTGNEGTAEDGVLQLSGNNKYLHIKGNRPNGGTQDVILKLGNRTTGKYLFEFELFLPAEGKGYYSVLHQFESTSNYQHAYNVYFNGDGTGYLRYGGTNYPFDYTANRWNSIRQEIDIDEDSASLIIDGNAVSTWQFSETPDGRTGENVLSAVNFYPIDDTYEFYVDHIKFEKVANFGNAMHTENRAASDTTIVQLSTAALLNFDYYPNPANSELLVSFDLSTESDIAVEFIPAVGKTTYKATFPKTSKFRATFDVSNYTDGVYYLRITTSEGQLTKQLVIIK